jgi:hypothetical protein
MRLEIVPLATLLVLPVGCLFGGGNDDGDSGSPQQDLERDIEQFNELTETLDTHREEALSKSAMYPRAVGNHLFWLQFAGWAPTLHSHDHGSDTRTNYQFSVGEGDDFNFEASTSVVATAEPKGNEVVYRAYAANAADEVLGVLTLDAPPTEAKWWDYKVVGDSVFIVEEIEDEHWLRRWDPATGGAPTDIVSLEGASGAAVGEFWTFAIHGNTMIYVESGRIWKLDLNSKQASWVQNEQQVLAGAFDDSIAIYDQSGGLVAFSFDTADVTNLSERIVDGFELNETFSSAHHYNGNDFFLWRDQLVYTANSGVFAYGLQDGIVTPILLEPRPEVSGGDRITYRYPVVLDSGLLFVTGLTSSSGSVGADGPIYQVSLGAHGL